MKKEVIITDAKRTPIGSFQGMLSSLKGFELGALAIRGVIPNCPVDEVFMGCVLPAGQGQNPARQATIHSGLPDTVPATTINKVCASGMRAIMMAADDVQLRDSVVIAGGMESMTNAPYLLEKARTGYRMGHGQIIDHMIRDGLEDTYTKNPDGSSVHMGLFADATAERYSISREAQEKFAAETWERVIGAQKNGSFGDEIIPVSVVDSKGNTTTLTVDEPSAKVKPEKFPALRPAFSAGGTVTAGTASSIADGAAALCLMSHERALSLGQTPLARIVGYASNSNEPKWFTTAPVGAIQKVCHRVGWALSDVDLFEINEAFAIVPLVAMQELSIPRDKVNIHGGACSLGHPLGASGARVIVTLIHALRTKGLKRGVAAVCIGGGEATAIAIEVI
ncbi:MAG: thiolase family protein [Alphaproteobacteria bacterium]|nr:thiolase family protein [Alphaproteobacteria bacterium]